MADYLDRIDQTNEADGSSIVQEPMVSMNVGQTTEFLDRHYDPKASIEDGISLHEGFDLLRERMAKRVYEANRIIS